MDERKKRKIKKSKDIFALIPCGIEKDEKSEKISPIPIMKKMIYGHVG